MRLNCKKSAEAIVPGGGMSLKEWEYELNGKGRTMGSLKNEGKVKQCEESRKQ
jgi:hypothetical protein